MITPKKPVIVYAELTPNPNSMKFVADRMLLANGTIDYFNKEDAADCPLAAGLFDFTGVKSVFITSNFITISKAAEMDWYDITAILREYIKGSLESGAPLFLKSPFPKPELENIPAIAEMTAEKSAGENVPADLEDQIRFMLDEYVRPAVEGDGGAIDYKSFSNGIVTVVLRGSCSGCPSSTLTLKAGIENLLKKMVPQVKEVVAESL